jgi:hypothetical protein
MLEDLMTAGVDWVGQYHYGYQGDVFFTRLHVTYDRKNFPQDLMFQETANRENFQARYIIQHPAYGDFSCSEGKHYVSEVMQRRKQELNELAMLTGWDVSPYYQYASNFSYYMPEDKPRYRMVQHESTKQMDAPEQNPKSPQEHDSSTIKQESFSAPYFPDDNNNDSSGKLQLAFFVTMMLLICMILISRNGDRKKSSEVIK